MKRSKFLTLTLVIVVIFAGGVPAMAGGFGRMDHRHWAEPGFAGLKAFLKLDLNDSQRSQLLKIIDNHQSERRNAAHNFFEARKALFRAMNSEKFDETNLRKAFERLSSTEENSFVLRARMRSEMKAVLTPEQIALLQKRQRGHFIRTRHQVDAPPEAPAE